mgnify:FL=1
MSAEIQQRIKRAKESEQELDNFIKDYMPFICSCANKATGRYLSYGESDELSIALMAFAEAVKKYNFTKGNFFRYSEMVIKRRIIDCLRRQKKRIKLLSIDQAISDENDSFEANKYYVNKVQEKHDIEEENYLRREEIELFKAELAQWDISLEDLIKESPKQTGTRRICKEIVTYIIQRNDLIEKIIKTKQLPIAEIQKNTEIPRKKIERLRKYIIALIIVYAGDYTYMKYYLKKMLFREEKGEEVL